MPEEDHVAILKRVPLFEDIADAELGELGNLLRRRTARADEVLWHEGDESTGMAILAAGRVAVTVRRPDGHAFGTVMVAPGEPLGEIELFDGGRRTATVRATEAGTLLWLDGPDFAALLSRRNPSALVLRRRIAQVTTERLRQQLHHLADSIGGEGPAVPSPPATGDLEPCAPPDSKYVRRMATFHAFDALALWGFLMAGHYAQCPSGCTLVTEGAPSDTCYLTINGAVEKLLIRGDRRIRVGMAGPGHAFGYESLIDGGHAPLTAITRERTLLLVLPRTPFERLFSGEGDESHVFLEVIARDITASLRQTLRPQAPLTGRANRLK